MGIRNETVARAVNAARNGGAHLREFDGCAKAAFGDVRRQCVESLGAVEAQAKRLMGQCVRCGDAASWSAIHDRLAILKGVAGSILRDIDHAMP